MSECSFCKIISGERPSDRIFQDELVTAFWDIHPTAPIHILIVPNQHIDSANDLTVEHESLVGHMFVVARQLAEKEGIADKGYRLLINCGRDGGQVIYHLHLHLLGGKPIRHTVG